MDTRRGTAEHPAELPFKIVTHNGLVFDVQDHLDADEETLLFERGEPILENETSAQVTLH